jgi:hypothetical protein
MKKLELNIKCCQECPYIGIVEDENSRCIGCTHSAINKQFGGGFAISDYTLDDCPLFDIPDRMEQHHIKSQQKCLKCQASNVIIEDSDRYPFRCLACGYLFGGSMDVQSFPEHNCRDHKIYSKQGCTCCWSCKICGQFGGCDNNAGRSNWKV